MRVCTKCGEARPEFFYKSKNGLCKSCTVKRMAAYNLRNKEKIQQYQKEYRSKNKAKLAKLGRVYVLRTRFGITEDEYDGLLRSQGGVCALCRSLPKGKHLAVDHDHTTGKVRGLLCAVCNKYVVGLIEAKGINLGRLKTYLFSGE